MELPLLVPYPANINQEVLKEFPHVVGGVDLLHFHLSVHVAVVQEVDIGDLYLDVMIKVNVKTWFWDS